jgi:hypothetical protein
MAEMLFFERRLRVPQNIAAAALCLTLLIPAELRSADRSRDLERLDFLAGHWYLHPRAPVVPSSSPSAPAGAGAAGEVHYDWHPGNLWLSFILSATLPGVGLYEVSGGVTFEPQSRAYVAYAVNNLAPQVIEYRGRWKDRATLVFDSVGARGGKLARVQYARRPDGNVVFSASESPDGNAYHTYFEAVLSRTRAPAP